MSHKKSILVLVKLTIENGRHIEVSIQANPRLSFLRLCLSFYDMIISDLEYSCWVKQYTLQDDQSFNEQLEIDTKISI